MKKGDVHLTFGRILSLRLTPVLFDFCISSEAQYTYYLAEKCRVKQPAFKIVKYGTLISAIYYT